MLRRFVLCTLTCAALLAACGSGSPKAPSTPSATATPQPSADIVIAAGAPITVGVSVALSGDQQAIGNDIADAADLSIADFGGTVQGHPVVTLRKDDGCTDPRMAVGVARQFLADSSVAGVVGPMCTTGAQAANPVYEAAHVVHISPATTRDELSGQGERYFFRTSWSDSQQARLQARYARNTLNAATAVVIDDGRPYGKRLADTFVDAFQALGGQVVSRERTAPGTVDFTSLAQRVLTANPALVVYDGLNPEAALLVRELRAEGYTGLFMAPDGVFSARDYLQVAGAAAEGSVVSAGPQPDAAFITRFHAKFQRDPGTAFVLEAYDAVTALLRAVDRVAVADKSGGLRVDRARVAEALRSQKMLGLTGVLTFDANGDRAGDAPSDVGLVLFRVTNGQFVPTP